MQNRTHRFSIPVNCNLSDEGLVTEKQQDFDEIYEDNGFLILPDGYSKNGPANRLVINCHGAGGTVTTDDSQAEHQALMQYLVANGYAVMDVGGLPTVYAEKCGIDIYNNIGCPIAIRSYVKAYRYCMAHFNLKPEVKAGLTKKDPHWLEDFDIAHPLGSWTEVERIAQAGLDASYQEFCIGKEVKASYGEYYNKPKPEENK